MPTSTTKCSTFTGKVASDQNEITYLQKLYSKTQLIACLEDATWIRDNTTCNHFYLYLLLSKEKDICMLNKP